MSLVEKKEEELDKKFNFEVILNTYNTYIVL